MKPKPSRAVIYDWCRGSTFATRAARADGCILRLNDETVRFRNCKPADGGVLGNAPGVLVGAGATHSNLALAETQAGCPDGLPAANQLGVLRVTDASPISA